MREIIDEIIEIEWNFFDKVVNEGGRAGCQDDWATFSVMRKSQYMAWSTPLLESWRGDLKRAKAEGRNPLTEKYGYMMYISDPRGNEDVVKHLPEVSKEKKETARRITERLIPLNETFRERYPRLSGRGRPLRTEEEKSAGFTSVETYQLGELWTYSQKTLELFEENLANFEKNAKSYPETVIENSLILRGFDGLSHAEEYLLEKDKRS